ncbi:hypothetical protein HC251_22055 [Iamia sp. SCSIO 61187]|uniref:hypothetical protein n=1 Tax=Iamia sp. SCSIO 61187 TaxID=2722752 RepID=UPI001C62F1EF|nr:hypothetical protein [Iamia sp. SCSIO 61187]QYG94845.1 hypothetical protein HC251_22055 [Iamia sp. SCSIO 61187]
MNVPRVGTRVLAAACALSLLVTACGDDGDDDAAEETTETTAAADGSTTAAADEPEESTTTSDPVSGDGSGDGTEGDPEAVALAERINLTIDDFAEGWTEQPAEDDDGGANIDDCFVETAIESVTVGEAETGTFSVDVDATSGQVISMQTVVVDSAETASALLDEVAGDAFGPCVEDVMTESFGDGATATVGFQADDPSLTEESVGLVGSVSVPGDDGATVDGLVDLHVFRTGEVISFTATLDIGDTAFEETLTELYTVIADRHATEVG